MPSKEKYGFVYLWYDRKHKRYYVGCRWGSIDDGYVCSSRWMKKSYGNRPKDFKRRILKTGILSRLETYQEEQRWLNMIRESEIKPHTQTARYYNLNIVNNKVWHSYDDNIKTIGGKISSVKKGKKTGPMSEERKLNISEAKKKAFVKRGGMTDEHRKNIGLAKQGLTRSEEAKQKTSYTLKQKWEDEWAGRKKQSVPKMSKEDQAMLSSDQLKSRWADPEWATEQKQKLKDSWDKRKSDNPNYTTSRKGKPFTDEHRKTLSLVKHKVNDSDTLQKYLISKYYK